MRWLGARGSASLVAAVAIVALAPLTPNGAEVDSQPGNALNVRSISIAAGITLIAVSVAAIVAGIAVFAALNPPHTDLVSLQWAGSANDARKVVGDRVGDFLDGPPHWDFFLTVAYTVGLVVACQLGRRVFCNYRPLALVALWARGPRSWQERSTSFRTSFSSPGSTACMARGHSASLPRRRS